MTVASILMFPYFNLKKNRDHIAPRLSETSNNDSSVKPNIVKLYLNGFSRYYLNKISQIPSHHFINFCYKRICLMNISANVTIYSGLEVREPNNITIGEGTIIGNHAILDGRNKIYIGKNVNLSSNVSIWTEQHDHRDPYFRCETQSKSPVIIGDRV